MKDRIRQIMEAQHMTQKNFANYIGMSEGSLSSVFNGRTRPTLNIVEAIKSKFPAISLDWLMFGKGKMYESTSAVDGQNAGNKQLSSTEPVIEFPGNNSKPLDIPFSDVQGTHGVGGTLKNPALFEVKNIDKTPRQITEIRVFFDDQTWESFVPKK
ncbi:MAG: helix-turn-helix transcriptional regulator [Prevotella sp.]|nr:helix-turn-helix transcriptional regulator [Prevotella sp.]